MVEGLGLTAEAVLLVKIVTASLIGGIAVGAAVLRQGSRLARRQDAQGDKLAKLIEASRQESAEGRRRVHERIDDLREHIDDNFVRSDIHEADMRATRHALDENQRLLELVVAQRRTPETAAE